MNRTRHRQLIWRLATQIYRNCHRTWLSHHNWWNGDESNFPTLSKNIEQRRELHRIGQQTSISAFSFERKPQRTGEPKNRDKHWEQLLFISGSSSPGAVFFSYWIWARGQRLVERDRDKHWVQLLFISSSLSFSFNSSFYHRLPIRKNCKLCPPWNCKILQLSALKL